DQSKSRRGRWLETANSAPTISGVPDATVRQDGSYSFLPNASDPDGDTLSFSVINLPRWASFDPMSGQLFGTPGLGDIGLYDRIAIGVSDGQASAELPMFAIEVVAYANGAVTLQWVAPTENTDGTPLLDLAGYEIVWGPQSGNYSYSADIANPGITAYMVENLTAGTYYFAVRAINDQGVASRFSNEATRTIDP
ncbi:MAG TPA: putative Ig domain-containing protein, partial [Gammaproteobacteria bacterium]|nr:putative Ig domain-containing protein [Gammaproteobacteria bacterium]